jgi:hypothetical protein
MLRLRVVASAGYDSVLIVERWTSPFAVAVCLSGGARFSASQGVLLAEPTFLLGELQLAREHLLPLIFCPILFILHMMAILPGHSLSPDSASSTPNLDRHQYLQQANEGVTWTA